MEVEKMNANLLVPVFLHTFDPFRQSKEVQIKKKMGQKIVSSYETQIKDKICPECNNFFSKPYIL